MLLHFSVKFGSCFWRFEISKQARKAHKMLSFYLYIKLIQMSYTFFRGRWDHDRMVVGFITTYAISAYHHKRCEFESSSGEVYSIQYYVIKFVSDSRQVGGFLQVLQFPSPIKLTAMIELGLNTINQTKPTYLINDFYLTTLELWNNLHCNGLYFKTKYSTL